MQANESSDQKRIVEALDFTAKTAKRVTWEAWEFTVVGPHQVEVTNASYGFLKDDHSYVVGVAERDGVALPVECECPADLHSDRDCKHKIALATVGGPTVLNAADDCEQLALDTNLNVATTADKLRADGGGRTKRGAERSDSVRPIEPNECGCSDLRDNFPCWPCVRDGKQNLPE
jgi:hypothetical protein